MGDPAQTVASTDGRSRVAHAAAIALLVTAILGVAGYVVGPPTLMC